MEDGNQEKGSSRILKLICQLSGRRAPDRDCGQQQRRQIAEKELEQGPPPQRGAAFLAENLLSLQNEYWLS